MYGCIGSYLAHGFCLIVWLWWTGLWSFSPKCWLQFGSSILDHQHPHGGFATNDAGAQLSHHFADQPAGGQHLQRLRCRTSSRGIIGQRVGHGFNVCLLRHGSMPSSRGGDTIFTFLLGRSSELFHFRPHRQLVSLLSETDANGGSFGGRRRLLNRWDHHIHGVSPMVSDLEYQSDQKMQQCPEDELFRGKNQVLANYVKQNFSHPLERVFLGAKSDWLTSKRLCWKLRENITQAVLIPSYPSCLNVF